MLSVWEGGRKCQKYIGKAATNDMHNFVFVANFWTRQFMVNTEFGKNMEIFQQKL